MEDPGSCALKSSHPGRPYIFRLIFAPEAHARQEQEKPDDLYIAIYALRINAM